MTSKHDLGVSFLRGPLFGCINLGKTHLNLSNHGDSPSECNRPFDSLHGLGETLQFQQLVKKFVGQPEKTTPKLYFLFFCRVLVATSFPFKENAPDTLREEAQFRSTATWQRCLQHVAFARMAAWARKALQAHLFFFFLRQATE